MYHEHYLLNYLQGVSDSGKVELGFPQGVIQPMYISLYNILVSALPLVTDKNVSIPELPPGRYNSFFGISLSWKYLYLYGLLLLPNIEVLKIYEISQFV